MHYVLEEMMKIENLDSNKIKRRKNHTIGYSTLNRVKPLHLNINKVNGYIDYHNGNKYLTLVHTNKGKEKQEV